MLQEELEKLILYATDSHFVDRIYQAKKEYREISGEIYEDD